MSAISDSDEIFFHGVNLDDMFVLPLLNNILKFGRAYSPDYIARVEPGMRKAHSSMRDIDIQVEGFPTLLSRVVHTWCRFSHCAEFNASSRHVFAYGSN
jgi:hypothetical protein